MTETATAQAVIIVCTNFTQSQRCCPQWK